MSELQNISVVLPSLDPDEKLLGTIDALIAEGFCQIILVNDGSKPENLHYFETAAQHPEVVLLHHKVNRGKGCALKTAFNWFLDNCPESKGVITVDGDGQHHSQDTKACALHMLETNRLTLGVRDFSLPGIPARSRSGNRITSAVFKIFVGMTVSDTQTGLRAIPRKDVRQLCTVKGDRFEYETNMLLAMKEKGIRFDEVKIRTVYIEENKSSHFHPIRDSWRIYKLILAHFFKYMFSSLGCALVDNGLFTLFTHLFQNVLVNQLAMTAVPSAIARVLSSLLNFFVNKNLVFHNHGSTGKALVRYYALAVPQAIAQMGLTYAACSLLRIGTDQTLMRSLIYAIVMTVLFIASFMLQQRWVFAKTKER